MANTLSSAPPAHAQTQARIQIDTVRAGRVVRFYGEWTILLLAGVEPSLKKALLEAGGELTLDFTGISKADSAGKMFLSLFLDKLRQKGVKYQIEPSAVLGELHETPPPEQPEIGRAHV